MAQVTTLAASGASNPITLNPVAKTTVAQLTVSAGTSGNAVVIQMTLDDPTTTPAPTVAWSNLSSTIVSSVADGVGVSYTVLSPIGGLRISSSSAINSGTVTLKSLQAVSA